MPAATTISARMKSTLTLASGNGATASSFHGQGLQAAKRAGLVTETMEPTGFTHGPTHWRVWKITPAGVALIAAG